MFNFFKKLTKPEEESEEEIPINEIVNWSNEVLGEELRKLQDRAKEIKNDFFQLFSQLKNSTLLLKKAEIEDEGPGFVASRMTRDLFVKKILNQINNLQEIDFKNYSNFKEFSFNLSEILKNLEDTTPKQAYLLSTYFKNEAGKVIGDIKRIKENLSYFQTWIKNEGKPIEIIEKINYKQEKIISNLNEIEKINSEEKEIKTSLETIKKEIFIKKQELENILKREEIKEFEKLNKILEKIKRETEEVKNQVLNEISSIEKVIKKFNYIVNKGYPLSKEEKLILKKFLNLEWLEESELKIILTKIKELTDKTLNLKEKEREKLFNLIKKIDEGGFSEKKKGYEQKIKRIKELEAQKEKYSQIFKRKEYLENELNEFEKEKGRLENELKNKIEKKRDLENEVSEEKNKLEEFILENIQKKIKIKI